MIIVGGNDDNAGVDNGDDDNVNNDNKNVNDDDDAGSPSRVLLYALSGWVERFNLSWMVLLNTFPVAPFQLSMLLGGKKGRIILVEVMVIVMIPVNELRLQVAKGR